MKWFAIDDQRVEVIHQFNIDNPTSSNVPRKNKNINTGFIVLTSFGGHGAIDFVLSVINIIYIYYRRVLLQILMLRWQLQVQIQISKIWVIQ